jgi:trehalose-phosphatase
VVSAKPIIDSVRRKLEKEIEGIKGAWIEGKKFTFTLHYRTAGKEDIKSVKDIFYGVASDFSERVPLLVIKGKKVLELSPDLSWNKGMAVLWLLERLGNQYLPIYVGDDITDESVFRTLYRRGITVRVGWSKKSAAKYYLKGQREVLRFLQHILDTLKPEFTGSRS